MLQKRNLEMLSMTFRKNTRNQKTLSAANEIRLQVTENQKGTKSCGDIANTRRFA